MPLIALTGGPGAGKTAVITALSERGYDCVPESARAIIQERLKAGLSSRPLAREFAEVVLRRDIQQYARVAAARGPVFFDRCIVDALSMFDQTGLALAQHQTLLANHPYSRTAFSFPPWEEIYTTDAERDQTFAEAVAVYEAVTGWYRKCGYDLIEVPRRTVCQRCDFVLKALD